MIGALLWKLATFVAVVIALYAVLDNSQRVRRLEIQVCDTVSLSLKNVRPGPNQLAYYREHPDETTRILAEALETKRRFHCPIEGM